MYVRRRWNWPGVYTFTSFATANIDYEEACARTTLAGWPTRAQTTTKRCRATSTNTAQTAKGGMGSTGAVDLNHLVEALPAADKPANKLQVITVGPVSQGDADAVFGRVPRAAA
ncbi:MAG: hypothetical protein ACLRYE_00860 [Gemmiger formicilis]|uniref:hypothetical protein n=1 Tax=Gemmiger formicilis TaxID=745368 RepID=UPI0039A022BC